jgi:glycosyltransferase involved in cell wall biosynthesis
VIVAARNEADRVGTTLDALREAFPDARLWVADDASDDETQAVAIGHGAQVVSRGRPHGKGGNVTAAADSAGELPALVAAVEDGNCELAIAAFARRVGGGFGLALGFARWAIERRSGYRAEAPISGQRAMRTELLRELLPFAAGYGMEIGMTIDAVRGGHRVRELELDLSHRATGRSPRDFLHRGRQLLDFARVYWARRRKASRPRTQPNRRSERG